MPSKKLNNITESSKLSCQEKIQNLYVASRLPISDDAFVWTDWFPLGSQSFSKWIKSGQKGAYLIRHKKKGFFKPKSKRVIYTGQGGFTNRIPAKRDKFLEKPTKPEKDWSIVYKLYNLDKNINNWEVCCCIINTGNADLDNEYKKDLETTLIEELDLKKNGLNTQSGAKS
jgi:hypothetical protein